MSPPWRIADVEMPANLMHTAVVVMFLGIWALVGDVVVSRASRR